MQIIESLYMTEPYDDWSAVRSPSRALRRMRYGCRQNVVTRQRPRKDAIVFNGVAHMHPVTAQECRRILSEFTDNWKVSA